MAQHKKNFGPIHISFVGSPARYDIKANSGATDYWLSKDFVLQLQTSLVIGLLNNLEKHFFGQCLMMMPGI
jgi:hypothetical protein